MKKLLYYSPFIPLVGFITHVLWIIFRYKIYTMEEKFPAYVFPMILQGVYIVFAITIFLKYYI